MREYKNESFVNIPYMLLYICGHCVNIIQR